MAERRAVTIRLDRKCADDVDAIVRKLRDGGLQDVERHDRFLIVNGNAQEEELDALRAIDGVASVREDSTYRTS